MTKRKAAGPSERGLSEQSSQEAQAPEGAELVLLETMQWFPHPLCTLQTVWPRRLIKDLWLQSPWGSKPVSDVTQFLLAPTPKPSL